MRGNATEQPGSGWGAVDRVRLAKARSLTVTPINGPGSRQYKVGAHYVDLSCEQPCHCKDALLSVPEPQACKHQLAAMLYEGWEP